MIMQIMINFWMIFTMIQSVPVPNLKSFAQMKAELWAKNFGGFWKWTDVQFLPTNMAAAL